ncbi:MAG: thiamine-phosphate kinase [Nitrospira sp.]
MARRQANPSFGEFDLIRTLERRFARRVPGLVRGIGDDAAVIAASARTWWHLTTDLLAEGIHFDLTTASFESVGYRAAMANLSDIAAMGAVPRYVLTSIAIPRIVKQSHIHELYAGLMKACRMHGVALIGGDTSASNAGLFLSLTLVGTTTGRRTLFRHGAKVGDHIFVSGTLGDSLAGLKLLMSRSTSRTSRKNQPGLSRAHRQFLLRRHSHPTARVAEGQWLTARRLASAAIDLSDGLSGDLRHLCQESRVGAEVALEQLPISSACRAYARTTNASPIQLALAGGEDYELLFTASPRHCETIAREARTRGYRITCIGTIRPQQFGIQMTSDGRTEPMRVISYEHFR